MKLSAREKSEKSVIILWKRLWKFDFWKNLNG